MTVRPRHLIFADDLKHEFQIASANMEVRKEVAVGKKPGIVLKISHEALPDILGRTFFSTNPRVDLIRTDSRQLSA